MRSRGEEMTTDPRDEISNPGPPGECVDISDCNEAVRQLYAFMDNELTEQLRAAFEAHLDSCRPCEEVVTFEVELRRIIADRCQDRVPDELRKRIAAAISEEADDPR
jgi:mycothiol system anti-sigma-R factor